MTKNGLIPTGIRGLDEVLLGGVRQGNMILVEGAPGTGKTTLGLEFIHKGAVEYNEPGMVVTFELSPEKVQRDASGFGWDFKGLERAKRLKIIYTAPSVILQELHSHDGLLMAEMRALGVRRVLIDGLTPLRLFGELVNGRPFRDTLHLLLETLQAQNVTAVLTRETPVSSTAHGAELSHEQFVCDTVLTLRNQPRGRGSLRDIEVFKSRGQDFITGKHTLRIEPDRGVEVYRRAEARPRHLTEQPTSTVRRALGVEALDTVLGKGVSQGSVTLVVGVTGTGKTVLGVQFLLEGARQGEKGLLVTLDEHPAQIMRNAQGLGLALKAATDAGEIVVHYDSPQELELDVHFHRILELVDEHKAERVVIDSLGAYRMNYLEPDRFHDFVYALTTAFKDRLVTAFLNYESPELLGLSQISEDLRASTIVDNIVLLNYVEFSNRLRRAITVPKARGTAPSRQTHEYVIQQGGITLLGAGTDDDASGFVVPQLPFSAYYGVLARSPARESPVVEERVANGESLPASVVPKEEDLVKEVKRRPDRSRSPRPTKRGRTRRRSRS